MNKNELIINQTIDYVKSRLSGEETGHDWWHIYRVWKNAIHIGCMEHADMLVVELAALLHDIADWKFNDGNEEIGPQLAREWLEKTGVEDVEISHICQIIRDISFKGAGVETQMKSIEGMVVQDADRLDAIGAIGIARTFAYGGSKGREMYNPTIKPVLHTTFEEYKNNRGTTVNHFYEKLLLLKDLMNTPAAKQIAEKRHSIMEDYLQSFLTEWDGIE